MKNLVTGLMLAATLLLGGLPAQAQEPTDADSTTTTTVQSEPATPDVNVDVKTTTTAQPAQPTFDVNVSNPVPVTSTNTVERTTERTQVLTPVSTPDSTDSSTVLMLVGGGLAILIILALVAMAVNRNDTSRTIVSDRREVVR